MLNGTSTSNKVVTNAVLRRGDLVLFDRNNHKSLHQGALVQAGRDPDLPADGAQPVRHDRRGRLGRLGRGPSARADPTHPLVTDPERHQAPRPFRLACIQLATYDGTVYNVRKVLERIGHLCDYVLWDEAWIGYNAFHPLFADHSPMRLEDLGPEMPGCSRRSRCTSRAPASRRPRRSTSATSTSAARNASSSTSASTSRS